MTRRLTFSARRNIILNAPYINRPILAGSRAGLSPRFLRVANNEKYVFKRYYDRAGPFFAIRFPFIRAVSISKRHGSASYITPAAVTRNISDFRRFCSIRVRRATFFFFIEPVERANYVFCLRERVFASGSVVRAYTAMYNDATTGHRHRWGGSISSRQTRDKRILIVYF